jgi:hypothetical protein
VRYQWPLKKDLTVEPISTDVTSRAITFAPTFVYIRNICLLSRRSQFQLRACSVSSQSMWIEWDWMSLNPK